MSSHIPTTNLRCTSFMRPIKCIGLIGLISLVIPIGVSATNFSSTNFIVKDPVIEELSSFSTSTNFQVQGTIPYITPSPATSTNFMVNPGFLAYQNVIFPTLTATAGPEYSEITLSWTPTVYLANPTYELGIGTLTGGPYTYDAPQTSLTSSKTNLSFVVTYFFVVRVKDGLGAIVGYSNEAHANPQAFPAGSGGGRGGGGEGNGNGGEGNGHGGEGNGNGGEGNGHGSFRAEYFQQALTNARQQIGKFLSTLVPEFLKPKQNPPEIATNDLERFVPRRPQLAFSGLWELLPPEPLREIVLRPLPRSIQRLAGQLPQLGKLLAQVGISRFQDLEKIHNISLRVPGLTDVLSFSAAELSNTASSSLSGLRPGGGLSGGKLGEVGSIKGVNLGVNKLSNFSKLLSLADLTPDLKKKFPTDVLFASVGGGKIDLRAKLSLNPQGQASEQVATVAGKEIYLTIKPDGHPKTVRGYFIFKSRVTPAPPVLRETYQSNKNYTTDKFYRINTAYAASVSPASSSSNSSTTTVNPDTTLVLEQFDFTDPDGDGIYTANVPAPAVAGNYEIATVINYENEDQQAKAIRLLTIIDPEGYIYELKNDKEIRIPGAVVSLDWLNPDTKKYELWPAKDFIQENPQVTDQTGQYAFLVSPGFYRLHVSAPGYAAYDGKAFQVREEAGIHENIQLRNRFWFLELLDWKTVLIILILFLLLYNFYRDKIREKESKEHPTFNAQNLTVGQFNPTNQSSPTDKTNEIHNIN